MDKNGNEKMVTLVLNEREYVMPYGEIANSWDRITDSCGYNGTGGDWRHIAKVIQGLFQQALEHSPGTWFSEYKPYITPPVAIKIHPDA